MIDLNERALTHEEILVILAEALGYKLVKEEPEPDPVIISRKPMLIFTCRRCRTVFQTRKWVALPTSRAYCACPECGGTVTEQ